MIQARLHTQGLAVAVVARGVRQACPEVPRFAVNRVVCLVYLSTGSWVVGTTPIGTEFPMGVL